MSIIYLDRSVSTSATLWKEPVPNSIAQINLALENLLENSEIGVKRVYGGETFLDIRGFAADYKVGFLIN
ncbi:MAG: hypothetical protein JO170_28560 [Verrucomicrobia bacterium]|nr:hypothetical protein [Verrucomicrobiota bacterium]